MADIPKVINIINRVCNKWFDSSLFAEFDKLFREEWKYLNDTFDEMTEEEIEDYKSKCYVDDVVYAATFAANSLRQKHPSNKLLQDEFNDSYYGMFYSWISNKIVYSFDTDVTDSFQDIHWSNIASQPFSILNKLPVNAFAIALNKKIKLDKEYDILIVVNNYSCLYNTTRGLYFLLLNSEYGAPSRAFGIGNITSRLDSDITFQDMYKADVEYSKNSIVWLPPADLKKTLMAILPYILYLCSQNAEISQPEENGQVRHSYTVKSEHEYGDVKHLVCGEQTGIRIRNFKQMQREKRTSGKGSMMPPHIRRAHYHRYWVGSGENKHIEIKWIAPIYVHEDLKDFIKPTNARVKEKYK